MLKSGQMGFKLEAVSQLRAGSQERLNRGPCPLQRHEAVDPLSAPGLGQVVTIVSRSQPILTLAVNRVALTWFNLVSFNLFLFHTRRRVGLSNSF